MKKRFLVAALVTGIFLWGCGGGGGGSVNNGGAVSLPAENSYILAGHAQKGPFAIGSQISVNELNSTLSPTGKTFNVSTSDNLGSFTVPLKVSTSQVEIIGSGYYMDELTGQLSVSQISLRAIADLGVNAMPTVNVLTSLQVPRLRALVAQGKTYAEANAQSQSEVLSFFGIDSGRVNSFASFYSMNIAGNKDSDAVLMAASVILSQMASDAARSNGTNQASELSNYINTIAAQISISGAVTTPSITTAKELAASKINFALIRANLDTYYIKNGVTIVAANFEEWIDQSGSGVLPQRLVPVTGLSFPPITEASPGQIITSSQIIVAGLGAGVAAPVIVSAGATLIKNNTAVVGLFSQVKNGDIIALRATSPGYGLSSTTSISIGSSSAIWTLTSQKLSGIISGLTGAGLVLQNNGADNIAISSGATSFSFPASLASGATYSVSILAQPNSPAQLCGISNGSGMVGSATSKISINCYAAGPANIAVMAGDLQSVVQHSLLPKPITVIVTDYLGKPVIGTPVSFSATPGSGYIAPVFVNTDSLGRASWSGYIHSVGQKIDAAVAGVSAVTFSMNVTPGSHLYDGAYSCATSTADFTIKIVNGIFDSSASIVFNVYKISGSVNEIDGALTGSLSSVSRSGTTYLTGQMAVDVFQHATASGNADTPYNTMDPFRGAWTCNRN